MKKSSSGLRKEEWRRRVEEDECTNSLGRNLTSEYVQIKTSITMKSSNKQVQYVGNEQR
jgi:hypothetical protein